MPIMYDASVPVLIHKLGCLKHIVQTGAKHVAENVLDEATLINYRLYPDMLPFRAQINIPTDILCGMTARITGHDRLTLDDNTDSFDALIARIDSVIRHLKSQDPSDYEGAEDKTIELKTPLGELKFKGLDYLHHFVFPNLYFHITTAYNILRHNGVKLGKADYIRGPQST